MDASSAPFALIGAISKKETKFVEVIIRKGLVDMDNPPFMHHTYTPFLVTAALYGNAEIMQLLINAGCSLTTVKEMGADPTNS